MFFNDDPFIHPRYGYRGQRRPKPTMTELEPEAMPLSTELHLEKPEQWRYDRLKDAGYTEGQSLLLAIDKAVDLHKAVDLAAVAGPETAYQIVS